MRARASKIDGKNCIRPRTGTGQTARHRKSCAEDPHYARPCGCVVDRLTRVVISACKTWHKDGRK